MKTKFSKSTQTEDYKSYYIKEYSFFNGEYDVIFNILEVNFDKKETTLAITNLGRISVCDYNLFQTKTGRLHYFEYGVISDLIFIDDFKHIQEAIGKFKCISSKNMIMLLLFISNESKSNELHTN